MEKKILYFVILVVSAGITAFTWKSLDDRGSHEIDAKKIENRE